ncbi:MAG: relaxase/mobilization nuclease domain-containing protein [Eubacteriales bacterium]|nr:relaxase/mobilization nuclease domain-containing protein [Eubacteriales bacterium]
MILFFLYLTAPADFATIIRGYIYPDNLDYKHYHDCKKSYWDIRSLSDKLCQKHGLSVIEPTGKRGMKYKEWSANKEDKGWKIQIQKDINQTIKFSSTYEEFLALMKAKG